MKTVSKTLYVLWRACPNNAWLRLHRPDVYFAAASSEYDQSLIEAGVEVEMAARNLFGSGVLVAGDPRDSQQRTNELLSQKIPVVFQAAFERDQLMAFVDVLTYDRDTGEYSIYEIKASTRPNSEHLHDLAFQLSLLRRCGLKVRHAYLLYLDPHFRRNGPIRAETLFSTIDLTDQIAAMAEEIERDIESARSQLLAETEPKRPCCCIHKARSNHCTTFGYSNPQVPLYSVHDLVHIGSSPKKLKQLVDGGILSLADVPPRFALSDAQRAQVEVHQSHKRIVELGAIAKELGELVFPLHFIDYETFAPPIPLFDGYGPYQPIPLQYSLHVVGAPDEEVQHREYLQTQATDPSEAFVHSLSKRVAPFGSIIVWNKSFESSVNDLIAERLPVFREYLAEFNDRMYDLKDIFAKLYFVDRDFHGSTSIKRVLPVLAPDLSYSGLAVQDGTSAAVLWGELLSNALTDGEAATQRARLAEYCALDSYGMVAIWRSLGGMLNE